MYQPARSLRVISGMSNTSTIAQAAISLPKGGGAVKGIGVCTGTENHSIPIALSRGPHGFGPTLAP